MAHSVSASGGTRRSLRTIFLRAPYADWPSLSRGVKTEFRAQPLGAAGDALQAPTPVVLYAVSPSHGNRFEKLMVLREHRVEQLMDISQNPSSLRAEGYPDYDHFRRYWRARTRRPFDPLQRVHVFGVVPWTEMWADTLGPLLLGRLYRDFLPPPRRVPAPSA